MSCAGVIVSIAVVSDWVNNSGTFIHKICCMYITVSPCLELWKPCSRKDYVEDHCTLIPVSSGFGFLQKPRSTSAERNMLDTIENPKP